MSPEEATGIHVQTARSAHWHGPLCDTCSVTFALKFEYVVPHAVANRCNTSSAGQISLKDNMARVHLAHSFQTYVSREDHNDPFSISAMLSRQPQMTKAVVPLGYQAGYDVTRLTCPCVINKRLPQLRSRQHAPHVLG